MEFLQIVLRIPLAKNFPGRPPKLTSKKRYVSHMGELNDISESICDEKKWLYCTKCFHMLHQSIKCTKSPLRSQALKLLRIKKLRSQALFFHALQSAGERNVWMAGKVNRALGAKRDILYEKCYRNTRLVKALKRGKSSETWGSKNKALKDM